MDADEIRCRMLVIDDNGTMAQELMNACARLNADTLPLPEQVRLVGTRYRIECEWCATVAEAELRYESFAGASDVFVIDRKFDAEQGKAKGDDIKDLCVLATLRDMGLLGIRIVWTAWPREPSSDHPEIPNIVQCMRLGAWDYLDKNSARHGNTYTDVIVSAIEGIEHQRKLQRRAETDRDGSRYVSAHFAGIQAKYKGNYVAFRRSPEKADEWVASDFNPSLWGLYRGLHAKAIERDQVYVTRIAE